MNLAPAYQEPTSVAPGERPRVVALILAYNVAGMLERALSRIPRDLVDAIFVMDDGSSDGTADEARRLGLTVYTNERNQGYGGNLRRGLRRALDDYRADYVVEVHGDGAQFHPGAIAEAVPFMRQGVPLVLGSRFIVPGRARANGMSRTRFLANQGLSAISRRVLGLPLTEFHSGFRVYSRAFIERLPMDANASDHLFSFQIIAQAAYFGLEVREVPVEADYVGEHTSISLPEAAVYSFGNLACLARYVLARAGLHHSGQFPAREP